MALSQQKFREIVFQLLYSHDIGRPDESLMTELMMGELAVSKRNVRLAQERVALILKELPDIDRRISSVSTSYDFQRIQTVTKNILRLSVFELFFDPLIPPKVAIAEAIRLSRKFNTPESATFVNALLDQLYQESLGLKGKSKEIEQLSQELMQSEKLASDAAQLIPAKEVGINEDEDFPHDKP